MKTMEMKWVGRMKTKKPPLRRLGSARAGDKVRLKLYWARPELY
jgi:hypothetical protein